MLSCPIPIFYVILRLIQCYLTYDHEHFKMHLDCKAHFPKMCTFCKYALPFSLIDHILRRFAALNCLYCNILLSY